MRIEIGNPPHGAGDGFTALLAPAGSQHPPPAQPGAGRSSRRAAGPISWGHIPLLSVSSAPQPPPSSPCPLTSVSRAARRSRGPAGFVAPRLHSEPLPRAGSGPRAEGWWHLSPGTLMGQSLQGFGPQGPQGSPGPQSLPGDTGTSVPCWRHPGASCLAPGAQHPPHLSVFGRKWGIKSPTGKKQDREKK